MISSETNMILGFAEYMFGKDKLKVVNKEDSILMKFVAWFLNLFNIMDKRVFMEHYTTTMFGKVYLCYRLGDLTNRSFHGQMSMIAHECVHSAQKQREGATIFRLRYLFSEKYRAQYEMQAYGTSIRTIYKLTEKTPDPGDYAEVLKNYKCSNYINKATEYYEIVIENIEDTGYDSEVDYDMKQWIDNEG